MQFNNIKIKVIDNFLSKKDLILLANKKIKLLSRKNIAVYHNQIDSNLKIKNSIISKNELKNLHNNYHPKAIKILRELNQEKLKLYDYSEFHIVKTGADYKFPIHDDNPNKLLSGVIYLKPKKNTGTIFYKNKKGIGKKIIKWKINRAVFFSRLEKKTWHSYEGNHKENRVALVYNLMTKRLKDVYKIEKKNYFLGMLRFLINPYIIKFFNKII